MNKYYLIAKLLFITSIVSLFSAKPSQASTLLFISGKIQLSIPVDIELQKRIQVSKNFSPEGIMRSKYWENSFLVVLEPNGDRYNRETGIKLMGLPIELANSTQDKSSQLLVELGTSLNKLSWNGDQEDSDSVKSSTILTLPQADNGNVYRNIYDFEITLTNSTDVNLAEAGALESTRNEANKSLSNVPHNLNKIQTINNPSKEQFNIPHNLTASSPKTSANTVSINNAVDNIDDSIAELSQNKIITRQNYELNPTQDIARSLISIKSPVRDSFSIPKTKEQEELEKKLEQQNEQLEKQKEQLEKLLKKQQQERERKKEQEARKLKQQRQEELRQAQQLQNQRKQEMEQSLHQ
jgi:hypothetical protein